MLQFIPNAPSTFLCAMSDAHLRMIHYFESILFKGLIKPVGKQVNPFANQFEWFVQFPAARAESSEAVLTQRVLLNIPPRFLCPPSYDLETDRAQPSWRTSQFSNCTARNEEWGAFQGSYERGYTGVSYAEVFFIEKPDARLNSPPPSHLL